MKRRNFIALPVAASIATTASGGMTGIAKPKKTPPVKKAPASVIDFKSPVVLIHQKKDFDTTLSIGVMWEHNGDYCRSAVCLPANPTSDEIIEAFALLNASMTNPQPATCVFGEEYLSGNEQKLSTAK